MEVLIRMESVLQQSEAGNPSLKSAQIPVPQIIVADCKRELTELLQSLKRHTNRFLWPIRESELKKRIESIQVARNVFSDYVSTHVLATSTETLSIVSELAHQSERDQLDKFIGDGAETSKAAPTALTGTAQWFLKSEGFVKWTLGLRGSVLWCHGPPGVGKSVISALASQYLISQDLDHSRPTISYFCDFSTRKRQTPEAIFRSLLQQMLGYGQKTVVQLLIEFVRTNKKGQRASFQELSKAFLTVASAQHITIFLDGLDELDHKDRKLVLQPLMASGCKILVTSRDVPDIRSALDRVIHMEIRADQGDLTRFVRNQFENGDLCDFEDYVDEFIDVILSKSNAVFLLARLLIDHLIGHTTLKGMRRALTEYPAHLEAAFQSSLDRIKAQSKARSLLAHRVIGWITHVRRPLKIQELMHSLAVEEDSLELDKSNIPSEKTILRVCEGLVIVNSDSTITMAHATIFEWICSLGWESSHGDIAQTCLHYLKLKPLSLGPCAEPEDLIFRAREMPFLEYAAGNWGKHILGKDEETRLKILIQNILDDPQLRAATFQVLLSPALLETLSLVKLSFDSTPSNHDALHVAAFWDLESTVSEMLKRGDDPNSKDSQSWTPLHWACFANAPRSVNSLLSLGAHRNVKDTVGWTALFWAALNGNVDIVHMLLKAGADYTIRDIHGWCALKWAAARKQAETVQVLLTHHVTQYSRRTEHDKNCIKRMSEYHEALLKDLTSKNTDEVAAVSSLTEMRKLLEEGQFDVDIFWQDGVPDVPVGNTWRALSKAERFGYVRGFNWEEGVRGLDKADPAWNCSLLKGAIHSGSVESAMMMLELGADVNHQSGFRTALHAAAFRNDGEFVRILVDRGAQLESLDRWLFTPLQQAVLNGFEESVRALLECGANVNAAYASDQAKDPVGRDLTEHWAAKTPLMLACSMETLANDEYLSDRMVHLLLMHNGDITAKDDVGRTALHHASFSRDVRAIERLLGAGADPSLLNNFGMNLYHHMALPAEKQFSWNDSSCLNRNESLHNTQRCLDQLMKACGKEGLNQRIERYNGVVDTPLSLAMRIPDWNLFHSLHSAGAQFYTNCGHSYLFKLAVQGANLTAVEMLLQQGACASGKAFYDLFVSILGDAPKTEDFDNLRSVLRTAPERIYTNRPTLVKDYLQHTDMLKYGFSDKPLDAIIQSCLRGKFILLQFLLGYAGENPIIEHWTSYMEPLESLNPEYVCARICSALERAGLLTKSYHGEAMCKKAVKVGNHVILKELISYGLRPVPMMLTDIARDGKIDVLMVLLESGAEVDSHDDRGNAPLHAAAARGHSDVVSLLLSHGASPSVVNNDGWTALHYAAATGHLDAARHLIQKMTDPNIFTTRWSRRYDTFLRLGRPMGLRARDSFAGSPLHLAAIFGFADVASLLVDAGVDINAKASGFRNPESKPTALTLALKEYRYYDKDNFQGRIAVAKYL
ncbi:ankyrin repeat-containing domain protein, partial [Xylariaceae sp. FL0255]